MTTCKNCNNTVNGNYCPNCGEPVNLKRIDHHYILHEVEHVLHFEKGIFYTIKELLIRPGLTVRKFIVENRNRLVKPIIFIIITSLIYTIINHFFKIEEGYVAYNATKKTSTTIIFDWVKNHYGYSNIIMGIFIALWLKLFFKKYHYNFFEILILLCFIMGMGMLLFAIFALIQGLTKVPMMQIAGILGMGYCWWAIGQFFDPRKVWSYLKALAGYILGMISFTLSIMLLGTLIDLIFNH
jgi:hypothetical protein